LEISDHPHARDPARPSKIDRHAFCRSSHSRRSLSLSAATLMEPPTPMHPVNAGTPTDNLFTQIGVRPILNGPWHVHHHLRLAVVTRGKSRPCSRASHYYVQMDEMMAAVERKSPRTWGLPVPSSPPVAKPPLPPRLLPVSAVQIPSGRRRCLTPKARNQVIIPKILAQSLRLRRVRMSRPEIV